MQPAIEKHLIVKAVALSLAVVLACSRAEPVIENVAPARSAQTARPEPEVAESMPAARRVAPYPPGKWRLARPQLQDVVLWVSHILIRYENVTTDVSFCQAGWQTSPPPARRRSDALALARSIAEQARRRPRDFAELARAHSEDEMTRARGGSLGGMTGLQLSSWPQVLDALAVVRPDEVSEVVETEYGFHVLYRRPAPPPQVISGSHIVIGHYQAPFLAQLRGAAVPPRQRAQALALANDVYVRASTDPERFPEWVTKYSEHLDAMLGGDLGQWSSHEPSEYPTQLEVLSGLRVGEISKPIETLFGWEVLLRTPNRKRAVYAMTPVEVFAHVGVSAASVTERTASGRPPLQQASELAQLLREHPERFDELQRRGCCDYVVQWQEGRGWPPLMQVLQRLQLGQIAAEPIQYGLSYVIPKRVPARAEELRPTHFELPSPSEPALEYVFATLSPEVMAQQLGLVGERARAELGLSPESFGRLQRIREASRKDDSADPGARQEALQDVQRQTRELLGERAFERYLQILKEQLAKHLMERS
jgi:hypothetical protein